MKKLLGIALVALLVLGGCAGKGPQPPKTPSTPETPTETAGVRIGSAVSSSANTEKVGENQWDAEHGKFESNVTYATVVIEDGIIKDVTIDTAQNSVQFTATDLVPFEAKGTKKELGDAYGMGQIENGKGEWDKQIAEVEKYMIGKNVADLTADKAASDLTSSVSMNVNGYIDVVKAAAENAVEVKDAVKFAQTSTVSAKEEAEDLQINTVVSTLAVDKDGKVVYSFIDEMQQIAVVEGDTATADSNVKTKGQLKEDYGMSQANMVEWYKQVEEITTYLSGKSADEAKSLSADVATSVSIYAGGFEATVNKTFGLLADIK